MTGCSDDTIELCACCLEPLTTVYDGDEGHVCERCGGPAAVALDDRTPPVDVPLSRLVAGLLLDGSQGCQRLLDWHHLPAARHAEWFWGNALGGRLGGDA